MATFTIYADDGEYSETAGSIGEALAQFQARRPHAFVAAIVDDDMRPGLILDEQ
jgi:hypothetical protein